jgi:hypothetical protein
MLRRHRPFALSPSLPVILSVGAERRSRRTLRINFAAPAAKSKSKLGASPVAFDFPFDKLRVRSGRTETESTASEEVYESRVVRFRKERFEVKKWLNLLLFFFADC